ncbi:MAG: ClpXP protease specificity-enhancing factor SspB, partial [Candidatus Puniceispirillaceae bacterium]
MTDNDTLQTGLNYELLVEDALRSVVRSSLRIVEKVGLPGETHFYISFLTNYTGVEIDDHLRVKHPETMTIVLQHQFADLVVGETEFAVTLFFGGKASPMIIPFEAVT